MNEENLIDDVFYVIQKKWGTWSSYDKNDKEIITSLTEEQCISATRWYLKMRQEGFPESKYYGGKISGKL
jgi:hypothetical protein